MSNNKNTLNEKRKMRAMGREYLKTNPPVDKLIDTILANGNEFAYAFMPSDETDDKFPDYMIKNEEEVKRTIDKVIKNRYLKFDKIALLLEFYEEYGELSEYLDKMSKVKTPNFKNIKWYKFLIDNFIHDFRIELNYDFEELANLIEM